MDDQNDPNLLNAKQYVPAGQASIDEAWHKEQFRRSFDTIRVKNPTDKEFFVEWDHRYHRVPANGTADVPRFIATTYCRDMSVDIINKMAQKMHDEAIAERAKKGLPAFNNKYEENYATYMTDPFPKTNDWNLVAGIYADLWVGLVTEWGKDTPPNINPRAGEVDQTPDEVKILQTLANRKVDAIANSTTSSEQDLFKKVEVTPITPPPAPQSETSTFSFSEMKEQVSKEDLAKEVTNDD